MAAALAEIAPGTVTDVRDALEFSSHFLRATYASTYNRVLSRAPRVWGAVYKRSATPYGGRRQRIRTKLAVWGSRGYKHIFRRFNPDAILCTQFLPSEVLAQWREEGRVSIPVATVITDYAIHPVWVHRGMDRYFVATDTVKEELVDTGEVPEDRIEVTGVPIHPRFAVPIARPDARRELGLDPDPARLTILLMGGGHGWGPIEGMMEAVLELPKSVQALIIAGRNERLRARLEEIARPQADRVRVHGFTDRVDLFLAASDVLIGKSGGMTCSEAMARGVPMLVFRPIPGQEERNCSFLQEAGAAFHVHDLDALHYRLAHLLSRPDHLAAMATRARAIGRPRSAYAVAEGMLARV